MSTLNVTVKPRARPKVKAKKKNKNKQQAQPGKKAKAPKVGLDPASAQFLRGLSDPFHHVPTRLGLGVMGPTSVHTGWLRAVGTSAANNVAIVMQCASFNSTAAGAMSPVQIYTNNTSSTLLSAATKATYAYANEATLVAIAGAGRALAGGMRAQIRAPLTQANGEIYAGLIHTGIVDLESKSFDNLAALAALSPLTPNANTSNSVEVTYRCLDPFDLQMNYAMSSGFVAASTATFLVILYRGWLSTTPPTVQAVTHFESTGGTLSSADDAFTPSVAESMSFEQLSSVARRVLPPPAHMASDPHSSSVISNLRGGLRSVANAIRAQESSSAGWLDVTRDAIRWAVAP